MLTRSFCGLVLLFAITAGLRANPPVASYIFPAGGQRGTTVPVRVGGLFLYSRCGFEMLGSGINAPSGLTRTKTVWFEGSLLPLPDSQRQEDYPKDMAGQVQIDRNAVPGVRYWRVWTSQGATPAMKFVVGDLPETVEDEIDGDPVPVPVKLPITVNGRIFPREDVDIWSFQASKGQSIHCEVQAARLGSPLDARLEIRDARGHRLAESSGRDPDPMLSFIAPSDGEFQIAIHDIRFQGGQAYVYRLTISADPHINRFYPLGGKRGSTIKLELTGNRLASPVALTLPKSAEQDHRCRLNIAGKETNEIQLDVDDLPEFLETPSGNGNPVAFPAVLNGRIDRPGDSDSWAWVGRKGETLHFELRAARLGSPLEGAISIRDAAGKELARADAANNQDPSLLFRVPADGSYQVCVRDRFRSRGGPDYAYRLRVGPLGTADFRLWLGADAVTLPRKGAASLKITADRLNGFNEPITLTVDGLPPGVSVAPVTLSPGQTAADIHFKAGAKAAIKVSRLTVQGTVKKSSFSRTARTKAPRGEVGIDKVLLAVALPTPFQIKGDYIMGFGPRGTLQKRGYKIERGGFMGPLEISLADRQARHLQGVLGPTITIPAGANEFTYSAFLPPWMETGRTCRVCVMGVGIIQEPDGSKHEVSFSSVNQNEQLVAVVGPGRLAMELARSSITAVSGTDVALPLHIRRGQGMSGPVKVELVCPAHIHGISAMPLTIPAGSEEGKLRVRFASGQLGPFNMPVIIRATLMQNGEPNVAESNLEISTR